MQYDEIQQNLTTERLCLRLFEESDAAAVTELCNNYNIYKSTLTLPYPYIHWIVRYPGFSITDRILRKRNTMNLRFAIGQQEHYTER